MIMSVLEGMGNTCRVLLYLPYSWGPQLWLGTKISDERTEMATNDPGNMLFLYNFNNVWVVLLPKNPRKV